MPAVADGEPRKTVAKVLGVPIKSVSRWVRAARQPGGLAAKIHPGPTPGLTDADLDRLAELLLQGAKAHGWHNQLWTTRGNSSPTHLATSLSFRSRALRRGFRLVHPSRRLRISRTWSGW